MKKDPSSPPPAPRKTRKSKTTQPLAAPRVVEKASTPAPRARSRTVKAAPAVAEVVAMPPAPRLVASNRAPKPTPSPDAVALRAYEIFLARNCEHGHDLDDWFQAEFELANAKPARKRA